MIEVATYNKRVERITDFANWKKKNKHSCIGEWIRFYKLMRNVEVINISLLPCEMFRLNKKAIKLERDQMAHASPMMAIYI